MAPRQFTDWKITVESPDGQRYWFINQGETPELALANAQLWTSHKILSCELWLREESDEPAKR